MLNVSTICLPINNYLLVRCWTILLEKKKDSRKDHKNLISVCLVCEIWLKQSLYKAKHSISSEFSGYLNDTVSLCYYFS